MKLITRDTDYAVRVLLVFAARPSAVLSVRDLGRQVPLPRPILRKICRTLAARGILGSRRGKGGGFMLLRPPGEITLAELVGIFSGPVRLTECMFLKKPCPNRPTCPLRKELKRIEGMIRDALDSVSIESLLKKESEDG